MNESVKEAAARVRAEMKLDVPVDRTVHLWSGDTTSGITYCGLAALEHTAAVLHLTRESYHVVSLFEGAPGYTRCADCNAVLEELLAGVREKPPAR